MAKKRDTLSHPRLIQLRAGSERKEKQREKRVKDFNFLVMTFFQIKHLFFSVILPMRTFTCVICG